MKEIIWRHLKELQTPGFFVTADIQTEGVEFPSELDGFIYQKIESIQVRAIPGRKFLFREGNWKIYLTFFPTQHVVDEKYAMKNKFLKKIFQDENR